MKSLEQRINHLEREAPPGPQTDEYEGALDDPAVRAAHETFERQLASRGIVVTTGWGREEFVQYILPNPEVRRLAENVAIALEAWRERRAVGGTA